MTLDFETLPASALVLCPATQGRRGVATTFGINGRQAMLIAPDIAGLKVLCRQWGIEALVADIAEPVVVVARFITTTDNDKSDGLDDGLDDGLGAGPGDGPGGGKETNK